MNKGRIRKKILLMMILKMDQRISSLGIVFKKARKGLFGWGNVAVVLDQDWDLKWTEMGWAVEAVWSGKSLRLRRRCGVNRWRLLTGSWGMRD